MKTFLNVGYTIGYTIALILILHAINNMLNWIFGYITGDFFNWFFHIGLVYKILISFVCIPSFFYVIYELTDFVSIYIVYFAKKWFVQNNATIIISFIAVLANIVMSTIEIWILLKWNIWIIVMWITMFMLMLEFNLMLIRGYRTNKLHKTI